MDTQINQQHLREGNFVQDKKGHWGRVWIMLGRMEAAVPEAGHLPLTMCQPIPLTPEILEKCGFEKTVDGWRINDDKERGLIISFQDTGKTDPWIQITSNYQSLEFKRHVQYLHQLQNLYFALTGNELEIKM